METAASRMRSTRASAPASSGAIDLGIGRPREQMPVARRAPDDPVKPRPNFRVATESRFTVPDDAQGASYLAASANMASFSRIGLADIPYG